MSLGWIDTRFGSGNRFHLSIPKDINMRVPDEILKTVLFVGVKGDLPEWEWRGTGYLIALPVPRTVFEGIAEYKGTEFFVSTSYPLMFFATARHVAQKLEGKEFALRANLQGGRVAILEGHADQQWFYHPTESQYVDAAITVFFPPNLSDLDLFWVDIGMFADQDIIHSAGIGIGDEVFLPGLFTKVTETTANIPILRTGNLAMMPGEKIPYKDGRPIDAYLVESRSIGGLSGSPVFVRQTVIHEGYTTSGHFYNGRHEVLPANETVYMSGAGRTYFLGSMIGHWDYPTGLHFPDKEAVNMGISPIVPAHKIKEIITQPEVAKVVNAVMEEGTKKRHSDAMLDFAEEPKLFTQDDFEIALKMASRKRKER